jgi:hypothetical protein
MTRYNTSQAAAKLKVSRASLHFWIRSGRIEAPPKVRGRRWWTFEQIEAARERNAKYVPRRFGRPRVAVDAAEVAALRAKGLPWRVVA